MFYIYLYNHTSSNLFKSPDLSLAFLPNKFISNYLESVIYQSVSAKVLHFENKQTRKITSILAVSGHFPTFSLWIKGVDFILKMQK